MVIAALVDIVRLFVYGGTSGFTGLSEPYLVVFACLSALLGAFFGARHIHKITLRSIQILVSVLLVIISVGLVTGLLWLYRQTRVRPVYSLDKSRRICKILRRLRRFSHHDITITYRCEARHSGRS